MKEQQRIVVAAVILYGLMISNAAAWILNNPYPANESLQTIYYSSFNEQPKTLDPAKSYSANESQLTMQICEPPLQYNYLKRPYQLEPLTAASMPKVRYLDKQNQPLADLQNGIFLSVYTITIKPGILFQPHPAFAKDAKGNYRYLALGANYLADHHINELADFPYTGSRELTADDYIYAIKRLADPAVSSPIYGLMSEYIVGFREFAQSLPASSPNFVDLRNYPLSGVRKLNEFSFEITIQGDYQQFLFWLAMPFFSPIPWEADCFYAQPQMARKNLSFAWYPIGTGAFMLSKNNPNRQIILIKNPNFREDYFPGSDDEEDFKAQYLLHQGERLPLIHQATYTLEKENIPRWHKFLQGYYDTSGISSDSFDQAIAFNEKGEPQLSKALEAKRMHLSQSTDTTIQYLGFNMLDPVVGGSSERARKLRLAISIAVNFEEYIAIFLNGRGRAAQGPIPPGIFGYKTGEFGINPYLYQWDGERAQRRGIAEAQALLREAGYPEGRDPQSGDPLILHYDVAISNGPDSKAALDWMHKQFAQLGIDLNIRATQYNRFQEKMRNGNAQIFSWAWGADYPDPENFLFMFYSTNAKVAYGGENVANYNNPEFDRLFNMMKNHRNDAERRQLIDKMVSLLRFDAPWAWGINTQTLLLRQQWLSSSKPSTLSLNSLKYLAVNKDLRKEMRERWNRPILWPITALLGLGLFVLSLLVWAHYRKEKQLAARIDK